MDQAIVTELFLHMVRLNSPSKSERPMADFLLTKLKEMGLEAFEDDSAVRTGGNAGNVFARLTGTDVGRPVLLCAHMDTVQPTEGLEPRLDGGVIRTGGKTILGADDKAGIAAILAAVHEVLTRRAGHAGVELLFTVQEEIGSFGCREFDLKQCKASMAFVFDSGGTPGNMVSMTPTQVGFTVTVHGRAAHAGVEPEKGVNAIWVAGRALARLPVGRVDDETSLNFGVVEGGSAPNMVPDKVTLRGEIRSFDPRRLSDLLEEVERTFGDVAAKNDASVQIERQEGFRQYVLTERDEVVQRAQEALIAAGLKPRLLRRGGGSDANVLNERGLPSVNLAVGMEQDHSIEEHVAVRDLCSVAEAAANLITASRGKG